MTVSTWAWLLSVAGALLFFAAGGLFAARQKALLEQRRRAYLALDVDVRGEALRKILDNETRGGEYAGAVITDELGLVVAATGEHAEELAAYGALLAGVGAKTRAGLPIHELRQVTIEDRRDTTLTVRPIASTEANLALVTLAGPRSAATSTI